MIEIVEENEAFGYVTIEVFEEGDDHIPVMKIEFLEGYPIERSHVISMRDSVALLLHKMDMMIEKADQMVVINE